MRHINQLQIIILINQEYAAKSMQRWDCAKMQTSAVYALTFHAKKDAAHVNHSEFDIQLGICSCTTVKALRLGRIKISKTVPITGIKPITASIIANFMTEFNLLCGTPICLAL